METKPAAATPAPLSLRAKLFRQVTRALIRPVMDGHLPPTQQRQRLARIAGLMGLLLPRGTQVTQQTLGGVPTEWVESRRGSVQGYMLYLHGGAYVIGNPQSHRSLTAHLAKRCRLRVAVPDYRLAPEHPFPAAVDDALAAYRGLLDLGVAAQDILIAGDSAGGGLTLACALAIRDAGLPLPAGLICLSPWTDLTNSGASMRGNVATEVMLSIDAVDGYTRSYLGNTDPRTPLASPLYADLTGLPPLLIQVAAPEILFNDSTRFADVARQAGVSVDLQVWPEMWHVWQLYVGQMPEADDAVWRIAHFVNRRLSQADA